MGVVTVPDILVSDGSGFISLKGHYVADQNGVFRQVTAGCGVAFNDGNYYVLGEAGLSMVGFRADGAAVDSLSVDPPFHVVSDTFQVSGVLRMLTGATTVTFHFSFNKELSGSYEAGIGNVSVSNIHISSSSLRFGVALPEGTRQIYVRDFMFSSVDGDNGSIQISITSEPV